MNKEYKLFKVSPVSLTQYVSFHRDNANWVYDKSEKSTMQSKQAEGAAHLFNLLIEDGIALLADEVGMGKTIQALSVMATLWQQKPEAKILILAPRFEIVKNWINEYGTFINVHYKLNDDKVKTRYGNNEINPAFYCDNLYHLVSQYSEIWKKLFIGKISSFSSLFSKEDINARLNEVGIQTEEFNFNNQNNKEILASEIGELLKNRLYELSNGKTPFDLLIIDEAHYFRNKDGTSLRAYAAQAFFGTDSSKKLADKVLLLTATPNHTSTQNINSIFSYFNTEIGEKEFQNILNNHSVRRFRRLTEKGFMKYNYRHEQSIPATFIDNSLAEVFFGLYQKKLAHAYMLEVDNGRRNQMLNYLEGTEFIPKRKEGDENADVDQGNSNDFNTGSDTTILREIAEDFRNKFNEYPAHPKYDVLINEVIPKSEFLNKPNNKNLVFVRRIPSVREIAGRVNAKYDEKMFNKIVSALGVKNSSLSVLNIDRIKFSNFIDEQLGKESEEENIDETDTSEYELNNDYTEFIGSKVLDLFKVLKGDVVRTTHASNFRLRFTKSKPGIFPIFFAPGVNYKGISYEIEDVLQTEYSGKFDSNFYATCLDLRTANLDRDVSIKLKKYIRGKEALPSGKSESKNIIVKTLLTIFWNYLKRINEKRFIKYEKIYDEFNPYEKEAFSKFIEKGILLASSGLVDLYSIYLKVQKENSTTSRIKLYQNFTDQLEEEFGQTVLPDLITQSIKSFKLIVEKVFNKKSKEDLINDEWKYFVNGEPSYPYCGDSKNERVILSFNTPFFPDVLISTSVLQEGVNLQYFCNNIVHYGIAWTPGDNEQRVGRIDRMFGKIENELNKKDDAKLSISYPYLKNTIDQDHVANFIYKKYTAEERIDRCQASTESKKLDYSDFNSENWQHYFRVPIQDKFENSDPYGVKDSYFNDCNVSILEFNVESKIKERIINTLMEDGKRVFTSSSVNDKSKEVCIVDEKHDYKGTLRKQPIFVELNYNPVASGLFGETIYLLTLKTPLGLRSKLNAFLMHYQQFKPEYELRHLNTKICIDESQSMDSELFLYMKIEIPLFPKSNYSELSKTEIISNINHLVKCADEFEYLCFGGKVDIRIEDIMHSLSPYEQNDKEGYLRVHDFQDFLSHKWSIRNEYSIIEKPLIGHNKLEEQWRENHKFPLIKLIPDQNDVLCQVSFIRNDFQEKESLLLEKIIDYYLK